MDLKSYSDSNSNSKGNKLIDQKKKKRKQLKIPETLS